MALQDYLREATLADSSGVASRRLDPDWVRASAMCWLQTTHSPAGSQHLSGLRACLSYQMQARTDSPQHTSNRCLPSPPGVSALCTLPEEDMTGLMTQGNPTTSQAARNEVVYTGSGTLPLMLILESIVVCSWTIKVGLADVTSIIKAVQAEGYPLCRHIFNMNLMACEG